MDKLTKNLSQYILNKGISITHLSKKTDIPYYTLHASLTPSSKRNRSLRADEFVKLCEALELNPLDVTKL